MLYLTAVAIPIAAIAVFGFLSKKFSAKAAFIIRCAIFATMLASGITKQAIAVRTGYNQWYLPLHFSSTFYITVGLSLFTRGRLQHGARTVLYTGGLFMLAMTLASPAAILGNLREIFDSHIQAHGYFYHMFVLVQLFMTIGRGEYVAKKYDPILFGAVIACWGAVAIPCAFRLGVNYMGILHAYIPFMETLRIRCGFVVYLLVYFLGVLALETAVIYGTLFIQHKLEKR